VAYVEWLRVRRRLLVYAIIVGALVVLTVSPMLWGHGLVHGRDGHWSIGWTADIGANSTDSHKFADAMRNARIPLGFLLAVAAGVATLFTIFVARSLNAHFPSLDIAFTKPIGRERLALQFFAVDATAIAAAFGIALIVALGFLALSGLLVGHLTAGPRTLLEGLCALGIPLMFYGTVQAATAWVRGAATGFAAIATPLFVILAPVTHTPFGPLVDAIVALIRFFDPFVYLGQLVESIGTKMSGVQLAAGNAALVDTTVVVWALAAAMCAVAVASWKRLEA